MPRGQLRRSILPTIGSSLDPPVEQLNEQHIQLSRHQRTSTTANPHAASPQRVIGLAVTVLSNQSSSQ